MVLLQVQNISKSFGEQKVLQNVSFELEQGKIYTLMGANGSGKTTLFNLITGFLKPASGKIFFMEQNITHKSPYKINRKSIGRTFQDLRLITKLTVGENIILATRHNPTDNCLYAMLPRYYYRNTNQQLERKADEISEQFFLIDVKSNLAGEISYGQQKLLSLACSIANGATLLLLDEPVAGIQPEYRNKIAMILKQLQEQGKTILLIEHNTDFISEVSNKIIFLHEGKTIMYPGVRAGSEPC